MLRKTKELEYHVPHPVDDVVVRSVDFWRGWRQASITHLDLLPGTRDTVMAVNIRQYGYNQRIEWDARMVFQPRDGGTQVDVTITSVFLMSVLGWLNPSIMFKQWARAVGTKPNNFATKPAAIFLIGLISGIVIFTFVARFVLMML